MRLLHVHWHKLSGWFGMFRQPYYRCRCGSIKTEAMTDD